jgi:four helix bundle protein
MTNIQQKYPNSNLRHPKQKFDLEERTIKFSESIIDFVKTLDQNTISRPLISQLLRAGTSIGANYSEANEANSKKDFINKIVIAKKETKETKYWLRIIVHVFPGMKSELRKLWQEAQELNLILAAIIRNSQKKLEN